MMKGGAGTLLLAIFALPIPGFHFFLVPLFLGATLVIATMRWRNYFLVYLQHERCPECGQDLSCGDTYVGRRGGVVYCGSCRARIVLRLD